MNAIALLNKVIHVSTPGSGLQTALVGLAGVIVGAAITGGFAYWLERRKEHVAVRRAARLIDADLLLAEVVAQGCVEKKKWWPTELRLTSEGWQQHRDVIASRLSYEPWLTVIGAVMAIGHLQGSRDGAFKIQLAKMASDSTKVDVVTAADALGLDIADPAPAIPESTVTQIEPMLRDLTAGRAALAPLTRD
jgi:hypothetical protein